MHLQEARAHKAHLVGVAAEALTNVDARVAGARPGGLALGLASRESTGEPDYAIAVRYLEEEPCRAALSALRREAEAELDLRHTGPIRALSQPADPAPEELQQRVRPLRPGLSLAHRDLTAGTLGAFVTDIDGALFALSNWHVLAGSPRAGAGDPVLQPGPLDGGTPADRIGVLDAVIPLRPGQVATVDAALARLEETTVEPRHPGGTVTTSATAQGGERVTKIGRTTGVTTGRISAIELDEVVVDYGPELGQLRFDNQVEVEGDNGDFSAGGDSGSLIHTTDGVALGLLFAGSETGGPGGAGLTYANPIELVLDGLGVQLYRQEPA
ncbi:S1 family peptidase [Ruania suaedae]|uniref:S1 family peptidase n=1 Tax=Ruania suaedae TaxID=2897774 RepID=UPI001E4C4F7D|nr:S1 family peptidase [Ruania suaedae]UFU02089.1 S1 family peptidase [Ruania suaedae]